MAKTLLYRLFGVGKFPESAVELAEEGILLMEQGIPGSVTYRNFRAPGKWSNLRRTWHTTSIALTGRRLAALRYGTAVINVPYADERFHRLNFSLERNDTLVIAFDASLFHNDWSGTLEYRFRTPQAAECLRLLSERKRADEVTLDSVPPVVVNTIPAAGDGDVDPRLRSIQVRFSKPMQDGAFSVSTHSQQSFPQLDGDPNYLADQQTCVLPVQLEPERTYALWLNSQNFRNFKDLGGRSSLPYLLVFRTKA